MGRWMHRSSITNYQGGCCCGVTLHRRPEGLQVFPNASRENVYRMRHSLSDSDGLGPAVRPRPHRDGAEEVSVPRQVTAPCPLSLGYDGCVELLLEHEAFRNVQGNSFSPLHCAV